MSAAEMTVTPPWRDLAAVLLPVTAFLAIYSVYAPSVEPIQPDSLSYLSFIDVRQGGYPFFLAVLKPVIRDLSDYAIAQRLLYAVAVLILGWQLLRLTEPPWFTFLVEIALLFNPTVNQFHFQIMTESLFASLCALFFAAAFAHLRMGGVGSLAAASALAAYTAAVRPTGLVLLAALPIVLASAANLSRRRIWKALLAAIVPAIIVLALENAYYHSHHPGKRESLASIHLVAKAGLVETADPAAVIAAAPPESRPLQQAFELGLAPARRFIAGAPSETARCRLAFYYEATAYFSFAGEERLLAAVHGGTKALIEASMARLRGGLPGYFRLSADHLFCLWTFANIDRAESDRLAAYIDAHGPLIFKDNLRDFVVGRGTHPFKILLLRGAMYAIAAVLLISGLLLLARLAFLRRPSALLAAAGLCGLVMHGAMLLTALTAVGISRYTFALWVPMTLGVGLSALWIVTSAGKFMVCSHGTPHRH